MSLVNKLGGMAEKVLSIILGVIFLPVLFCIIVFGMNMDYSEWLKLVTLRENWILFLAAVPVLVLSVYLIHVCNKHPLSKRGNVITNMVLVLLCMAVYFLSVRIAKEIAFHLPWDISVVSSVAAGNVAEEVPLGYYYYLSIYTNNIPISYILGVILRKGREMFEFPLNTQFIWLQVNCILMTLAIFFSCLTIKRLTKNVMLTIIAFLLNFFLIGLSAWKIAPYTDTYGQLFPIMCIYFYVCYKQAGKVWQKIVLLVLAFAAGAIGGFVKPNVYVVLIAIMLAEGLTLLRDWRAQWKYVLVEFALMVSVLLAADAYENVIIDEIGLEINRNIEAGMVEYLYMGQNEESTGAYDSGDAGIYGEFQFVDRKERDAIVLERVCDRIREKGPLGNLYFWLRKMVMTFNDGLFGWHTEVWIESHYTPAIATNTALTSFFREIYWTGKYVGAYNTVMQLVWIYAMLGIPGLCLRKRTEKSSVILTLCFIGIFFYQMLFEARARYLFVFLPLILVCAGYGMWQYSILMKKWLEHKKKNMRKEGCHE